MATTKGSAFAHPSTPIERIAEAVERELARLREAEGRAEELRARKRAVLELYGTGLICGLEFFPPGLRRLLYGFLGLRVSVRADRTVRVEGTSTPT